MMIIMPAF